jgi:hypothetical protein
MLGTIYIICFLVGLGLALLRGALAMFGADTHADVHVDTDVGADADGDSPGGGLINLTVISTFITVFGGVGALMHYTFKSGTEVGLAVATAGGFALAFAIGLIIRKIVTSTQAGSEPVNIVGLSAEVITPIPAGGLGEVAYVAKGARYVAPARAKDGGAIEKSAAATIVETAGATCVVEKK